MRAEILSHAEKHDSQVFSSMYNGATRKRLIAKKTKFIFQIYFADHSVNDDYSLSPVFCANLLRIYSFTRSSRGRECCLTPHFSII